MVALRLPFALLLLRAETSSSFSPVPVTALHPTSSSRRMATFDCDSPLSDEPTPHSSDVDLRELSERMERQRHQYDRLNAAQVKYTTGALPAAVHIILFQRDTPHQHVHTVALGPLAQEVILAFESGDECVEFAQKLHELHIRGASPVATDFEPFAQFCHRTDTALMVVPSGFGLTPPQSNADEDEDEDEDQDQDDFTDDEGRVMVRDTAAAYENLGGEHLDAWG